MIILMKFSTPYGAPYGNVTPGLDRNRDGENSSLVTHGTFPIPHSWLSSCDKIKIPHSRLCRSWEIFISSRLLRHSWGIGNVPFVTREEFVFPSFVASPLMRENPIPISLQTGSGSYLWHFEIFFGISKEVTRILKQTISHLKALIFGHLEPQ